MGGGGMTRLRPVAKIESYAVIIRCIWERGATQRDALAELNRRRLWLSQEQKNAAGL
jgi:hypothetical protein